MPDFVETKVSGCYLYFTSKCVYEAFHAHSGARRHKDVAAKFFIRKDGSVMIQKRGTLSNKQLEEVKRYIKANHIGMFAMWSEYCALNGIRPEYYEKK